MAIAYDRGVNFFDNAEIYARGRSEIVMGNIFKKMNWERSSWLVSSKVYYGDGGKKPNQAGLSRKHIFEACHASLRRLQVDYLDLYFCHRPDRNTPVEVFLRQYARIQGLEWLRERNLTPGRLEKVRRLSDLARELGVSLAQLAVAWCVRNPMNPDVIERIESILGNKPVAMDG